MRGHGVVEGREMQADAVPVVGCEERLRRVAQRERRSVHLHSREGDAQRVPVGRCREEAVGVEGHGLVGGNGKDQTAIRQRRGGTLHRGAERDAVLGAEVDDGGCDA